MKSSDLSNFCGPYDFDNAYKNAQKLPGVYFLRLKNGRIFSRMTGETDIVYIGSSKNLQTRVYQYVFPSTTQWTNRKVNRFVKEYGHDSEFYWKEIKNKDEIKIEEHNLLRQYEKDHHEKPPLNGADIRTLKLEFQEPITFEDNGMIFSKS